MLRILLEIAKVITEPLSGTIEEEKTYHYKNENTDKVIVDEWLSPDHPQITPKASENISTLLRGIEPLQIEKVTIIDSVSDKKYADAQNMLDTCLQPVFIISKSLEINTFNFVEFLRIFLKIIIKNNDFGDKLIFKFIGQSCKRIESIYGVSPESLFDELIEFSSDVKAKDYDIINMQYKPYDNERIRKIDKRNIKFIKEYKECYLKILSLYRSRLLKASNICDIEICKEEFKYTTAVLQLIQSISILFYNIIRIEYDRKLKSYDLNFTFIHLKKKPFSILNFIKFYLKLSPFRNELEFIVAEPKLEEVLVNILYPLLALGRSAYLKSI